MTMEEAEEIYMAVEVGCFNGTRGEYAEALILLSGRSAKPEPAALDKEKPYDPTTL